MEQWGRLPACKTAPRCAFSFTWLYDGNHGDRHDLRDGRYRLLRVATADEHDMGRGAHNDGIQLRKPELATRHMLVAQVFANISEMLCVSPFLLPRRGMLKCSVMLAKATLTRNAVLRKRSMTSMSFSVSLYTC